MAIAAASKDSGGGSAASDAAISPAAHSGYITSAAPSLIDDTASGSDDRATQRGMKYGIAYSAKPAAASGASAMRCQPGSSVASLGGSSSRKLPAIWPSPSPSRSSSA